MTNQTLTCSKCRDTKPATDFYADKSRATGRQPYCKDCKRGYQKAYQKANRRKIEGRDPFKHWAVGDRFGLLVVDAIRKTGRDTVLDCVCDCGRRRDGLRVSNLPILASLDCGDLVRHPRTVATTYDGQHSFLKRTFGPAGDHTCTFCDERASDWGYRHDLEEPLRDVDGKNAGLPWSPLVDSYVPLCRSHHQTFDRSHHREGRGASELSVFASLAFWSDRDGSEWINEEDLQGPGIQRSAA